MKRKAYIFILTVAIAAVGLLYLWHDTAEAARLGGGKSFGSRPSYQRSAPAPSPSPTSPQMSPGQPAHPGPLSGPTPSPMGRWGGMLGGLLMGGLIGSLLFGGGHAYGGHGLLDVVLVGGGLFLLLRFLPLFLVVAMGEMRAIRLYLSERVWPVFGKRSGSLLLTIPLAVFLCTEEFHLHHVVDVSAPDLNFPTGPYMQYALHWYPRFDFKNQGRFLEEENKEGDVVVLEQVAMSRYLNEPFLNYVPEDDIRFKGIARKRGTEELWSGRPLISNLRQLASKVPDNGGNSLWIVGIVWNFHGGKQNLSNKYAI